MNPWLALAMPVFLACGAVTQPPSDVASRTGNAGEEREQRRIEWRVVWSGDPHVEVSEDGRWLRMVRRVCPGCEGAAGERVFEARARLQGSIAEVGVMHMGNSSYLSLPFVLTDAGRLFFLEPRSGVLEYDDEHYLVFPEEWELREVLLPAPATGRPRGVQRRVCVPIRSRGIHCWRWLTDDGAERVSERREPFEGGPTEVVMLTEYLVLDANGGLYVWRLNYDGDSPERAPRIIFDEVQTDVHALSESQCFVHGEERHLRCYRASRDLASYTGRSGITHVGDGHWHHCVIAPRSGHPSPWLYCWGRADLHRETPSWLMVGPHGIDPSTLPPLRPWRSGWIHAPRPVMAVAEGTEIDIRGFATCVITPAGETLCDRPMGVGTGRLPRATRDASAIPRPPRAEGLHGVELERFDF